MIDSHCHLDHEPLFSDLKNVIQRSKEIGVKKLLTISTSIESFSRVKDIVNKDEIISEAKSEIIEAKYKENTNSARENKIFGSPSFIVKNELFWGDDRMEDAIKWSLK